MARRPTSCKEAIENWEKAHEGMRAVEATTVELQFQWPPIEKMDGALSTLVACDQNLCKLAAKFENLFFNLPPVGKLSLSSNMIDKITGIAGLKKLKILSLGRNNIKSLAGIETVSETLEELWISYNPIDKLKGIEVMKLLRVLYMSNNLVKEWSEFKRLQQCPALRDLVFVGNPICDSQPDVDTWRAQASKYLQQIDKLDGIPIIRDVGPVSEFPCPE